jgi:tRNA(fMet)-specific endonuclease VapC
MTRYLLDTNTLSEPVQPNPDNRIFKWLQHHGRESATGAPVIQELLFGVLRLPPGRRRDDLERYVLGVVVAGYEVLPYDLRAAQWHSRERARLVRQGLTPALYDGFIAAIAAVHDLTLVTANLKDFRFYEGLRVESWKK